jgi:hypothetical protein
MRRKAQADPVDILIGLITISLVVLLIFFFYGRYFDLHVMIKEATIERHAITLAQILMSSGNLTYSDGNKFYRGVFDKDKLAKHMIGSGTSVTDYYDIIISNNIFNETSYPNTAVVMIVQDKVNGNTWVLAGHGPIELANFNFVSFAKCLVTAVEAGKLNPIQRLFTIPSMTGMAGIELADLYICLNNLGSGIGKTTRAFPVAIRNSDKEVNPGLMVIVLAEA